MKTIQVDIDDDEVLVALKRVEGYETVSDELLAQDAVPEWPEWRPILEWKVVLEF